MDSAALIRLEKKGAFESDSLSRQTVKRRIQFLLFNCCFSSFEGLIS